MSDIVPSLDEPRSEHKLLGNHKWRGKLFSADSRFGRGANKAENAEDDITNFLHTEVPKQEEGPRSAPLVPRVDAAANLGRPAAATEDQYDRIVDVYRRPKPRQNKGLSVRFDSTPPVVIGVGGDEAELPSRDVSSSFASPLRFQRSPSRERSNYSAGDQHPKSYGRLPDRYDETRIQAPSSQGPTGVVDELLANESHHAGHDREAIDSGFAGARKLPSQPRNEQHDLYPSLRKKEVRNVSHKSHAAEQGLSHDPNHNRRPAETRNQGATQHTDNPLPKALPVRSPIPNDTNEPPYVLKETSQSGYHFPSATRVRRKLPDAGHQGTHQAPQDVFQRKDKPLPLLSAAESLEDGSLEDFDLRVRRFNDLFRLNASAHVDIMTVPFERWVRTSAWWFLRGRGGLEDALRAKTSAIPPASAKNDGELSLILKQAYFSLAKAWWILKDVTPNLPAIRRFGSAITNSMVAVIRSSGDGYLAELVEVHLTILASIRPLTMSMKRNGKLPPDYLQMQRLESQIFLDTPMFAPEIAALTVNNIIDPTDKGKKCIANPFFPILVGDTSRHFSFCRIFVDASFNYSDEVESKVSCVVSILRERTDWAVKAAITSQDGQVNLVIESSEHGGLDWHGVQWRIPLHTMQLGIAEGLHLQIKFSEKDFKTIWGICDYTQQIRKEYTARRGEEVVYEDELPIVQCLDSPTFPAEPVKDCKVRLFRGTFVATDDSGQQEAHVGYRMVVITPSGTKTLSKVNYELEKRSPIFFSTQRSNGGSTLLVRVPSSLRVTFTFHEASEVEIFRSVLSGTSLTDDDHCSASLQLQNFLINPISTDQDMAYMNASRCINDFKWHKLRVINRRPSTHVQESQLKICSEDLRILTDCDFGTFTDHINVGPGELQLNLSVENLNIIKLLRAAQQDMVWSFADGVLGKPELSSLSDMLTSMSASSSVMTYHFRSLSDLHSFQAMLTGFHVLYDGLASTFSISRRRMVVPMHKRWEASTPRLQIVKQDKTVQLVAFFKDFSHGACMNFVLKVTDFFETFTRSGAYFLRLVDAKFSLPKGELDPVRDFVCLDMPEYPGEHDDIIIGFDDEQGKRLNRPTRESPLMKLQIERDLHMSCRRRLTKCLE